MEMRNYVLLGKQDGARMCIYDYLMNRDLNLSLNNRMFYEKADKIRKVVDTYDTKLDDYEKVKLINNIFSNIEDFNRSVRLFSSKILDYPNYEKIADKLVEISNFYSEQLINGTVDKAKEYNKDQKSYELLKESVIAINKYLDYDDSIRTFDFCKKYGYKVSEFETYVTVVSKFDKELYEKYLEKSNLNKILRIEDTENKCFKLHEGLENNEIDGHDFSIIDFFKLFPLFEKNKRKEILNDFNIKFTCSNTEGLRKIFDVLGIDYKNVINFIKDKKINMQPTDEMAEKSIYRDTIIINGRLLRDEDKNNIISYMKREKMPMIDQAFTAVRNAYLNDTLVETNTNNKVKKLINSHINLK